MKRIFIFTLCLALIFVLDMCVFAEAPTETAELSEVKGSENNDEYMVVDGAVRTRTNHAGGILGGMTNGEAVVFRVALKPTPSIFKPQRSVDLKTLEEVEFSVRGRHDPCVVLRAVPCVEAAAAIAVYDAMLEADIGERK